MYLSNSSPEAFCQGFRLTLSKNWGQSQEKLPQGNRNSRVFPRLVLRGIFRSRVIPIIPEFRQLSPHKPTFGSQPATASFLPSSSTILPLFLAIFPLPEASIFQRGTQHLEFKIQSISVSEVNKVELANVKRYNATHQNLNHVRYSITKYDESECASTYGWVMKERRD
jgi:hypothetical protein